METYQTATSSYDIYMVDTHKENNGDEATEDNPLDKQSRHRHHRRRSKPRHSKNSDASTGKNNPDGAEDEDNPAQSGLEQAEQEDGQPAKRRAEGSGMICLQRIYNFLLFHVVILSILDVL